MKKHRLIVTFAPYLKKAIEQLAKQDGCSQAEIIRTAIIRMLERGK